MTGERIKTTNRVTFVKHPEKSIEKAIIKFVQDNPANRRKVDGGKYWDTPLVGFASAGKKIRFSPSRRKMLYSRSSFIMSRKVSGSLNFWSDMLFLPS